MTADQTARRLRDRLDNLYHDRRESEAVVRLIFRYVKDWAPVDILIHGNDELSDFVGGEIEAIAQRLENGEPIQYITGEARFCGMDFKVNQSVLIPRPETAELVDLIADACGGRSGLEILDVGTGSGCIAIALARALPFSRVRAIDVSVAALEVAKENGSVLKTRNVVFEQSDIFAFTPREAEFDVIVSNPPYVCESEKPAMAPWVKNREPSGALFVSDGDPLVYYRRIGEVGRKGLKEGGNLWFEINPVYSRELVRLLESQGYDDVEILRDSYGKERFAKCTKRN